MAMDDTASNASFLRGLNAGNIKARHGTSISYAMGEKIKYVYAMAISNQ